MIYKKNSASFLLYFFLSIVLVSVLAAPNQNVRSPQQAGSNAAADKDKVASEPKGDGKDEGKSKGEGSVGKDDSSKGGAKGKPRDESDEDDEQWDEEDSKARNKQSNSNRQSLIDQGSGNKQTMEQINREIKEIIPIHPDLAPVQRQEKTQAVRHESNQHNRQNILAPLHINAHSNSWSNSWSSNSQHGGGGGGQKDDKSFSGNNGGSHPLQLPLLPQLPGMPQLPQLPFPRLSGVPNFIGLQMPPLLQLPQLPQFGQFPQFSADIGSGSRSVSGGIQTRAGVSPPVGLNEKDGKQVGVAANGEGASASLTSDDGNVKGGAVAVNVREKSTASNQKEASFIIGGAM